MWTWRDEELFQEQQQKVKPMTNFNQKKKLPNGRTVLVNFYSPCVCRRFIPTPSGQEVVDNRGPRRYREGTGQIVCGRCGLQDPRK